MKTNILSKLLAAVTLALCTCALLSCQTAPVQRLIAWEQTPSSQVRHQFEFETLKALTGFAMQVIVNKAVSNSDLQTKGNFFDSAALMVRSLEGKTDGIVTPQLIEQALIQGTAPLPHWQTLASDLSSAYLASRGQPDAKLEAIAATLNAH